jgi:hypothetical protein
MTFTRDHVTDRITAEIVLEGVRHTYDCSIRVCDNPLCQCNEIFVDLEENPAAHDKGSHGQNILYLGVGITEKTLLEDRIPPTHLTFARKIHEQLSDEDYVLLWEEYYLRKLASTENADFSSLQVAFPMEDIEQNSLMIAYKNLLPYAQDIKITVDGKSYYVIDLYCVKSDCRCTESILNFFPQDRTELPVSEVLTVSVDYLGTQWKEVESTPIGSHRLNCKTVKEALIKKYDNLYDLLAKRHREIKLLYTNYRKSRLTLTRSITQVGRNDQCPCGSGKKYKKCCGA